MCNFHVAVAIVPNQSYLWFEHHHQPLTKWQPLSEPRLGVCCFSSRLFPPHGDFQWGWSMSFPPVGAPYIHLSPGWHGKDGIENEVVSIGSIYHDTSAWLKAPFSREPKPPGLGFGGLWWQVVGKLDELTKISWFSWRPRSTTLNILHTYIYIYIHICSYGHHAQ